MKKRKRTGKRSRTASDFGSPELLQHHTTIIELAGAGIGRHRLRVVDSCEFDRLFYGDFITPDQHNSGIRLGGDVNRAGCKTNWLAAMTGTGKGGMSGGRFLFAVERISKAMASVQTKVGRGGARLVLSVACDERTCTAPTDITRLALALDALNHHYSSQSFAPLSLR